jgi:hypothetical protein
VSAWHESTSCKRKHSRFYAFSPAMEDVHGLLTHYIACFLEQESVVPMAFLRAKPIGVMQMIDQGEQDDKVQ